MQTFTRVRVGRSLWQLINTLVPLAALIGVMARVAQTSPWLCVAMAPLGGLLVLRTFILQHDLGHGTLLPWRWARESLGLLLGVLTLTPYHYWRWTHALHHKDFDKLEHRGDVGYFLTMTVAEYQALSPRGQLLYRLYRNPALFFLVGAVFQFFVKHRVPWDTPGSKRAEWLSVVFTNVALAAVLGASSFFVGARVTFLVALPVWLVAAWLGVALFYLQHTLEPGYLAPSAEWDLRRACLEGSSYVSLPQPLRWFTGDIGIHHVHHLAPMIPNYRLEAARLSDAGLAAVAPMSLRAALGALRLKLWDEQQRRFVAFPPAPERAKVPALHAHPTVTE